ncbi:MAG: polysulfide reductase NrfD [Thermincola ferriacetica]
MHNVTWPIIIAVYLFIAGVGVASFYTGMLANLFSGGRYEKMAKYGSYIAVPSIIFGLLMLIADLGRPLFFWHFVLTFRPTSTMSLGTWLLTVFTITCGIYMLTWLAEEEFARSLPILPMFAGKMGLRKICGLIALPFSFGIAGYTGVLLASTSAALWNSTSYLGLLFLISATSTGMAALMLVYIWKEGDLDVIKKLAKADLIVIIFEVIVLIMLLASLKSNAPQAASVILSGSYAVFFWLGIVVVGLLLPFAVEIYELLTARGHVVPKLTIPALAGLSVLVGGFLMRYVILYAGQV